MLSPLSELRLDPKYYIKTKPKSISYLSFGNYGDFKSIYDNNSINFSHYMGFKTNDKFQNPDYFKLPRIELNGTEHQFMPDKSQIECAKKLLEGKSVVYCAPTGTGKTAIAHFAVNKNLDENKRTIITVPLVALANDKYREFSKIYGSKNIGIMTGDRKVNTNAPIVIMTTEILYNQSQDLKNNSQNIGTVVFDEAHYLSDKDRGNVWENSIIACIPSDIQILCLSATIGNGEQLNSWVDSLNNSKESSLVELKPKERYVPLLWQIYRPLTPEKFSTVTEYAIPLGDFEVDNLSDKQKRAISKFYQLQNNKDKFYELSNEELVSALSLLKNNLRPYYQATEHFEEDFLNAFSEFSTDSAREISNLLRNEEDKYVKNSYVQYTPHDDFKTLINDLNDKNMLPALIFKLSRAVCDDIIKNLYNEELDLTTEDEKKEIEEIIGQYCANGYLGKDINKEALLRGYASHHAGKLPQYRKLVEELFSKKLLKVVSATSTLSAGINMPAKTVVLSDMTYKSYDAHEKEMKTTILSVNDFHQMAGRAGRRGIDDIGYVVLYNLKSVPKKYKNEEHNKDKIDELDLAYEYIASKSDDLRSQFRPDPVMIANYYNDHFDNSLMRELIDKSFKIFCAKDKDKVLDSENKKFENYSHILLKQGYIYRDYKNNYILTPKGKLLLHAQGANPLMVVNLIYDGLLDNISPETLAQIAGYIAGSDEILEPQGMDDIVSKMLDMNSDISKDDMKEFRKTRKTYQDKEERLLRTLKESKIAPDDIISSDNISGYILYLWSILNENNQDTIENFKKLSVIGYKTDKPEIKKLLEAKLTEGNIYRAITHSISVLKQIERICDFALSDSENYPNREYYEDLKVNAQLALELIEKEPVKIEDTL